MQTITIQVYSFEELSAEAQQKAIEECSEFNVGHHGWWRDCYEQVIEIAAAIGIKIEPNNIWFSGFYAQGDGASFSGEYSYKEDAISSLQKEFPLSSEGSTYRTAYDIAERLAAEQNKWQEKLNGLDSSDREYIDVEEAISATIEAKDDTWIIVEVEGGDLIGFDESGVVKCMKDFCDWIYRLLESEFEHLASEEQIKDTIIANDCLFYASGEIYTEKH